MEASKLLKKLKINLEKPVLLIDSKEALSNLMEVVEEYCSDLKLEKLSKNFDFYK